MIQYPTNAAGGPEFDPVELASLYAAGALTESERADFEARIASGDEACIAAMKQAAPAMASLAASFPEIEPPAEARRVLEMRLGIWETSATHEHHEHEHDEAEGHALADDPLVVIRKGNIKWRPTGLPGVRAHTLYADKKNNRRTTLLHMAPGSYIPDHDHAGIEEVLVLEGDLCIDNHNLQARDYFRAQPGTRHGPPRSPNGCIALVFSTYSAINTKTKIGFALQVLKDLLRRGKKSA